jgi:hypothetical protein
LFAGLRRGSDLVVGFRSRTASPPTWSAGNLFACLSFLALDRAVTTSGNGRGKHVERDALVRFILVVPHLARLETGTVTSTLTAIPAFEVAGALISRFGRKLRVAFLAVFALVLILAACHGLILIFVLVGDEVVTLAALFLEARPALVEDTEIMVRKLQIIFGLNAVARQLRVARKRLVLLVKLRRIPALTIVLAVAAIPRVRRAWPAAAAAPAAVLTIVDQT